MSIENTNLKQLAATAPPMLCEAISGARAMSLFTGRREGTN